MEKILLNIEVKETERNRNYWASRAQELLIEGDVRKSQILVLPWEKFRDDQDVFPEKTTDFYRYLTQNLAESPIVFSSTAEYKEIALHSFELRLPKLFVQYAVLPIVLGLATNYAYDYLGQSNAPGAVEIELIVEDAQGKCFNMHYKGAAENLSDEILKNAERCISNRNEGNKNEPTVPKPHWRPTTKDNR